MKIAIVGAGAMGSIYAGLLADAGNEVWAIDLWQDHIDAINTKGLRVEGASGQRLVRSIHASHDLTMAGSCDLYIISTKTFGVGAAAKAIVPMMAPHSLVLTIQNGLGAGERIARHMPVERVLLGVAEGFGAAMIGPGHVHHAAMKLIRMGEMQGGLSKRLQDLTEVWRSAGFDVEAFADIDQLIWEKFICNVTFSAPCTVFDYTIGEVMADPAAWNIALHSMREAYDIGLAREIAFSFDDPVAYVTAFGTRMPQVRPSMLLDHHAGRRSEIDAINGMVPVLAKEAGMAAPYNEVLSALVKSREATF